ncbi:MAG TPA: hypothetical protein PKO25_01655 [Spirochaetota bacterium]|jgi:hypothetical protein|nr:hypothetical protein [Spirochaetota bacterium]OPZ36365.1 MAG: hypothetical protein BWY96_02303 [Spirochaetes bacterium ADurb.BinA120]HNU90561.1 hypothetical protein [Spirochaetota bacterium]HPI14014.1 hypothetical protein [Spirochaetota bacterium]HPO45330.1 hypothetical protein [Spirochaetota bacterium]
MSIKPIDMQTNIAQMHEVARNAQVKSEAVVEQQHVLDKESLERSRLANARLEENKKAEKNAIMPEEKRHSRSGTYGGREEGGGEREEENPPPTDEKIGRFIDVKK